MRAGWSGPARVLDGKACAADVKADVRRRLDILRERGIEPVLGTILVGEDPGSKWYVAGKHRDCAEVGIHSIRHDLPDTVSQDELLSSGALVNLFPDWSDERFPLYAYHPSRRHMPAKTRAMLDFVAGLVEPPANQRATKARR